MAANDKGFDEGLDEIVGKLRYAWNGGRIIENTEEFKQAIKELVCKHRGCEPYEGLTEQSHTVIGCCKHCGNRDKIRRQP